MLDPWFQDLKLELPPETFHQLPRHPAYRYEYINNQIWISARPHAYHCRLDLARFLSTPAVTPSVDWICRPLEDDDWPRLVEPFAFAFSRVVPLCQVLSAKEQDRAAGQILERTRAGHDNGPLIEQASFVLEDPEQSHLIGTALVTLLPSGDLENFDPAEWDRTKAVSSPPSGTGENPPQSGQPHLTWIFVRPRCSRRGGGEMLLRKSAESLRLLGHKTLASTFMLGNHSSMLWHWRMGFELLSHILSPRRFP